MLAVTTEILKQLNSWDILFSTMPVFPKGIGSLPIQVHWFGRSSDSDMRMCLYIYICYHHCFPSVQVVSLRNSGQIFISNAGLPEQKNFHERSMHTINIPMHLTSFWCDQKQSWECTEVMHKLRGLALWNKPATCSSLLYICNYCVFVYTTTVHKHYANTAHPVYATIVHLYTKVLYICINSKGVKLLRTNQLDTLYICIAKFAPSLI